MNEKISITISSSVSFDEAGKEPVSFYGINIMSGEISQGFIEIENLEQMELLRDAINEYLHINKR